MPGLLARRVIDVVAVVLDSMGEVSCKNLGAANATLGAANWDGVVDGQCWTDEGAANEEAGPVEDDGVDAIVVNAISNDSPR